ncbi:glycosyltransferase [Acetobacteraceae bacterium]|nr:glycosyltransferase [Candidatus Parcubacteria bacterium]
MKKILFVITKANWGGAQRYVFDLATAAHARGHEVVVAYGQPGLLEKKLLAANINTFPILSLKRDVSFGADIKSFFELYRLFKKEQPDVVHLNSSKAGGVGALAARLAGVPNIIFTAHGWAFNENRNSIARALLWIMSWATALLVTRVICVSEYELRLAKRMPSVAKKAVRIYNGIDLTMHFGSGEVIRHSFPAGVTITGTVGELTYNKNHRALIEEAKNNPDMYVAIVGDGELQGELQELITKHNLETRVKLLGFIPSSEAMKGFDRFSLPSIKEGLGYVILEARAAGLPITANRVGGVGEALDNDMSEFSLDKMVEKTLVLYER